MVNAAAADNAVEVSYGNRLHKSNNDPNIDKKNQQTRRVWSHMESCIGILACVYVCVCDRRVVHVCIQRTQLRDGDQARSLS